MSIQVDAEDLCLAMESSDLPAAWFLDLTTGEVIFVGDPDVTGDEETAEMVEANPERYTEIEHISSSAAYDIMEDFVSELPPAAVERRHLESALEGKKPFRRFKDTLINFPELEKAWFAYERDAMCRFAEEWLADNEIDAQLVKREGPAN